jgi:hypothetical protein
MPTRAKEKPRATYLKAVAETPTEVGSIPARQLRCRAGHHNFPLDRWLPGEEPIPRGVTVMPASEGRLKLVEPCGDCLAVTGVTYTHPGGIFDGYLPRHIQYGGTWVKLDRDVPRSRRVMRDARYQAANEQIRELLGRVTTLVDDEEDLAQVPGVRFQEVLCRQSRYGCGTTWTPRRGSASSRTSR